MCGAASKKCVSLFQWHFVYSAGRLRSNCNIRGSLPPAPIFVTVDLPRLKRLHLCYWQMKSDLGVHRPGKKTTLVMYCCYLDAAKCMCHEGKTMLVTLMDIENELIANMWDVLS